VDGWIKTYRKLSDNPIWTLEPFTKGQAWVDLFLIANHKDGQISVRGNIIQVKRGQVGWSEVKLAERWKWSRNKVRRYLKHLETEQQIEQLKNSVSSIITIVNYELYQGTEQQNGQQTIQQKDSRRNTNKNDKNEKKNKRGFSFNEIEFPEDLISIDGFIETYKDWYDHRKQIKKPLTPKAVTLQLNQLKKFLEKGNNPIDVIEKSIANGWTGLFELSSNNGHKPIKNKPVELYV